MPPSELASLIRSAERELIAEGPPRERDALCAGGEVVVPAWPAELPPLTPELHTWFSWRAAGRTTWRSAEWAAARYRQLAVEPAARPALIPVLDQYLVDVHDGALWSASSDESGARTYARAPDASLSGLLLRIAREHAARRTSPWRRLRLAESDLPLQPLAQAPAPASLAAAEIGAVLIASVPTPTATRTFAWLKHAPGAWMEAEMRASTEVAALSMELWLDDLRAVLATGSDEGKTVHDDASAAASLALHVSRARGTTPAELCLADALIWEQPPLAELIARLGPALAEVAPGARRALAPPASPSALAALEERLGAPLPADVRALWSLADGQTSPAAFYDDARLLSVAEATHEWATLRLLATQTFGDSYWDRGLLPLLARGDGDLLGVDVAGAYGPPGGLWDFEHAQPDRRTLVFGSVAEWLECFVEGLEEGLYVAEATGGVHPRGFLETGGRFEVERHDLVRTNGRFPWRRTVAVRGRRSSVGARDGAGTRP